MHGIDDDARQAGRIEHAFLQVEFPGAVLLRHQPALQAVGEARDHALQIRELLVEIAAQAVELLRLAQLLGRDRLVEFDGEGAIVRAARLVVAEMARPLRLARGFGVAHVGVVGHVGGRRIGSFGGAIGHVLGGHLRVLRAHALHVVAVGGVAVLAGILLAALVLAFVVFLLGIAAAVVAHFERVEQIVHRVAELALVLEHAFQPVEIAPGAVLDQRTPEVDQLLGGRGRRHAGQPLAHHQRQRVLDRRVGALGDGVELAAVEFLVKHGGQILGDAVHAPRADRLDARLLDRLEHRARLLAAGLQAAVHRRIVAGNAQCDRVGMAAHDRRLAARELARRLRQPHLAAHQAGALGGEGHFQLRLARDGAQAAGDRALERLGRRVLRRRFAFDVRGHHSALVSQWQEWPFGKSLSLPNSR